MGGVVAEPVGAAVEGDDDGSVQESVEHRGDDGGVPEDLPPSPWIGSMKKAAISVAPMWVLM